MTTYTANVRLTRDLEDDRGAIGKDLSSPMDLAKQIALELQAGYDEASIAGHFQIETLTIDGVTHQIEQNGDKT